MGYFGDLGKLVDKAIEKSVDITGRMVKVGKDTVVKTGSIASDMAGGSSGCTETEEEKANREK